MSIEYVGDIEELSEQQLNFLSSVFEKQGYKNGKATVISMGKDGGNFMAHVKRISLEHSGVTFKIIAKLAPKEEMARLYAHTAILFKNEHIMYTKVLPKFLQLQENAEVPEKERLRYAECYGTLLEPFQEMIILEDLEISNFKILDRLQPLSDQCIKSILKNFATLHSLSYALKKLEPEMYMEMKNSLVDILLLDMEIPDTEKYYQDLEDETISLLDDNEHKRIIKGTVSQVAAIASKIIKLYNNSKHGVIHHGDSWTANLMFRNEDDQPIDSIMIDYQMSKECSPVYDILHMIFNCTDHESRSKHFHEWMDYYHNELDKSLSNFGLKANLVYPKDKLDVDLKIYGKLVFVLSIILSSLFISNTENTDKIKKAMDTADIDLLTESVKLSAFDKDTVALFKKKFVGLINSCTELGLL